MNTLQRHGAFISYSRNDKEFALEFAGELRSAGYLVWLDELDIPTGARWDDEVEKALHENEIFLIILTPSSVSSENVKDEIGYAIDHGKHILPVLLEKCDVPLRLRRFQYVDFTKIEFSQGIRRAKQLLEDLLNKHVEPGVTISPELEQQRDSGPVAIPTHPLPSTKKNVQHRWMGVGVGVGILLLVACLGLLGVIILLRGLSFPATPTNTPTDVARGQKIFGPSSGTLDSEKNGFLELSSANMNIHDFILEVTFYNPYEISEGIWDYGLFFHDNGADGYYFSLDARSNWQLDSLTENKNIDLVARGKVGNMNVSSGESNNIRLIVIDQTAIVYVNDEFVSRTILPSDFGNGNISVGIEFNSNNEVDGKQVRFEAFTIWAVQ